MVLWNLVLSGYPGAGKTVLAERLVSDNKRFARICGDDLRKMLFHERYPSRDEDPVFLGLMAMRDLLLNAGWNVVIDTTAPDNMIRTLLLDTKTQGVNSLLVVMDVERSVLARRNRRKGRLDAVRLWDRYWREPLPAFQTMRFKSGSRKEFEASYRSLQRCLERSTAKPASNGRKQKHADKHRKTPAAGNLGR